MTPTPATIPGTVRLLALGLLSLLTTTIASAADKIIDIMMVYTPAATTYNGGTSGIKAHANAAIASLNAAFQNSQIEARARLVYVGQISYKEASSFNTDLTALRNSGDGKLDTVHSLRTTYGADYVCLIRRGPAAGVAGLAYVMTTVSTSFSSYGFSVVADVYSTGNYAFAHEIGHNLGCNHDRANTTNTLPYNYAYGYNFNGNNAVNYGTVMCYPGTRVLHFSNPDVSYQGTPTGVASGSTAANNALAITNTRTTAAALKGPVDALTAGDTDGDGKADLIVRGADTRIALWTMDGANRTAYTSLDYTYNNAFWTHTAAGDLDGDGKADQIFRGTDGRLWAWFMDGAAQSSTALISYTYTTSFWTLRTAGDLNGDGKADLIFRGSDGRLWVWFMDGTTQSSSAVISLSYAAAFWNLVTAADLDGDGKADLIFRGTDGRIWVWFMNGTTQASSAILPYTYNAFWSFAAAGDVDGDGKADLLFRGNDGRIWIWFMDGATKVSETLASHSLSDGG